MIRILHADDHPLVRAGLSLFLSKFSDLNLVGDACDGQDAVEQVKLLTPDVALVDISMPNMGGLPAIRHIRTASPTTRVIILSVHEHRHYAIRSLQAGAYGYMHKAASGSDIADAIRKVHAGHRAMPAHLVDLESLKVELNNSLEVWELSKREQQVFYLLADCYTGHEAAKELGVSVKTVDSHRGQILKKLGLRSNSELTRFAIKGGLIES